MNTQAGRTPSGITTLVAAEYNSGVYHTTQITLTNFIVGALAGAAAALGVGNKIYTLPAGVQLYKATYYNLSLTAVGTAVTTKTGIGSVIASGAVSVLNGTATFQNYVAENNVVTAAGGGTAVPILQCVTAGALTGISLQTAASVKDIFLNSAGTWNLNNTGNLTATGTIVLEWSTIA